MKNVDRIQALYYTTFRHKKSARHNRTDCKTLLKWQFRISIDRT